MQETYLKSAAVVLVINFISTVLGIVTMLIVGLIVEVLFFPFSVGTYHISHWIVTALFIIPANAAVEGFAAKLIFKLKFKKNFSWLCLANAASLIICFLLNLSWTSVIFF